MVVKPWTYYLAILLVAGSVLCFTNLGKISLWNNNEPRYAHTARNMLESGDWITPVYKGKLRADKPILTYWLIMASANLLNHGKVNEFIARLPFAILGILGVIVIFLFGTSLGGARVGFISGLALLFTLEYITTARRCLPDMALCFFITLTLFLFYKGYSSREKKGLFYILSYIPAALGFLTKGPVAIVIPGGVAFIYLAIRRDLKEIKGLRILPGLIIFLVIVLPWFLAVTPEFSKEFFLLHNLKHFTKGLDHQKPWYFYFEATSIPYAPAIFFLPAGVWLWKKEEDKTRSPLLLPLIWTFFPFLIFSLAAAKRVIYLLPMAPALALIAGLSIDSFLKGEGEKIFQRLMHLGVGLAFLSLILVSFLPLYFELQYGLWLSVLSLLPLSCLTFYLLKGASPCPKSLFCLGLFFVAYALCFLHFQPKYDWLYRSAKPLAREIKAVVGHAPLYRMGSFDAALEFYLNRPYLPKVSPRGLDRVLKGSGSGSYIITREKYWRRLSGKYKLRLRVVFTTISRRKRFVLLESTGSKPSK